MQGGILYEMYFCLSLQVQLPQHTPHTHTEPRIYYSLRG